MELSKSGVLLVYFKYHTKGKDKIPTLLTPGVPPLLDGTQCVDRSSSQSGLGAGGLKSEVTIQVNWFQLNYVVPRTRRVERRTVCLLRPKHK